MEADWGKKLANVAFNIIMMIEIKKKRILYNIHMVNYFSAYDIFIRWLPPILLISLFNAPHVNKCLEEI